jgi:hypothetical protein
VWQQEEIHHGKIHHHRYSEIKLFRKIREKKASRGGGGKRRKIEKERKKKEKGKQRLGALILRCAIIFPSANFLLTFAHNRKQN